MKDLLRNAGFADIKLELKENAEDIISGWMPGSGAEKYVTSVYVTAAKPTSSWGVRDDPAGKATSVAASGGCCPSPAPAKEAAAKPQPPAPQKAPKPAKASKPKGC